MLVSAPDGQPGSKKPSEDMADCHRILLKRVKAFMVGLHNGLAGANEDGRVLHTSTSATGLNGHLFIYPFVSLCKVQKRCMHV